MKTWIEGNLDEIYKEYRHTEGQLIVSIFREELKPKMGESTRSTSLQISLPMTPLGKEVSRLISETGQNIYSHGGDKESLYIAIDTAKGKKLISKKHGQQELIRMSREMYLMIWLAVLDCHYQLKWNLRSVYPSKLLAAYKPFIDLSVAELELWRELLKYREISESLEIIGVRGYEYWFLTSNEWQVEHCLKSLTERPSRLNKKVWASRAATISSSQNPFSESDKIASFRFTLIKAALHVVNNYPMDDNHQRFLENGWVPYQNAIKSISKAIKNGVKYEGEEIKYRTPIIKGQTITTSEDPSVKFPLKKPQQRLHQRGNYDREKA
jgi:hypothetical protein